MPKFDKAKMIMGDSYMGDPATSEEHHAAQLYTNQMWALFHASGKVPEDEAAQMSEVHNVILDKAIRRRSFMEDESGNKDAAQDGNYASQRGITCTRRCPRICADREHVHQRDVQGRRQCGDIPHKCGEDQSEGNSRTRKDWTAHTRRIATIRDERCLSQSRPL